jgi:hypothetical protein
LNIIPEQPVTGHAGSIIFPEKNGEIPDSEQNLFSGTGKQVTKDL